MTTLASAAIDPPALQPTVIDAVVEKLNALRRTSSLEYALRIGQLIVKEVYQGDLARWRTYRERECSFRQLAARTRVDLEMSVTTIYRAVAFYELCSRVSVELWRDFGTGHLRAVLGLPEGEQIRLLSTAKAESWTARQLYEHALRVRGRSIAAVGAPCAMPAEQTLRRVLSAVKDCPVPGSTREIELARRLIDDLRRALDRLEMSCSEESAAAKQPDEG